MHACITLIGCAKNEGKIRCVIAQADQAVPLLLLRIFCQHIYIYKIHMHMRQGLDLGYAHPCPLPTLLFDYNGWYILSC